MDELREYDAVVNGTETTLVLTADDAKRRGLTGKGRALSRGEAFVDDVNTDSEEAQKMREDAQKEADEQAQKAAEAKAAEAQKQAKARTARSKVGAAESSPVGSPAGDK